MSAIPIGSATVHMPNGTEVNVPDTSLNIEESDRRNLGDGDVQDEVLFIATVEGLDGEYPDLQVEVQATSMNNGPWSIHSARVTPDLPGVTLDIDELEVAGASEHA